MKLRSFTLAPFYSVLCVMALVGCSKPEQQLEIPSIAFQTPYNDFLTSEREASLSIPISENVKKRIIEITESKLLELPFEDTISMIQPVVGPVFFSQASGNIGVYIFRLVTMPTTRTSYIAFAYDKEQDLTGNKYIEINGKYMIDDSNSLFSAYLNRPALYYTDTDEAGIKEMVVKERAHNGTAYNALIENHYIIYPNLDINRRIFVEQYWDVPTEQNVIVKRELKGDTIVATKFTNAQSYLAGWARVTMDSTYSIREVVVYDSSLNSSTIITGSRIAPNEFINNGYTFSY